ncbi:MAG: glutamate synthase-related protein [Candidatus Bathyarchaeia archaeon]
MSATGTTTRVRDVSPTSGMCPICIRDCTFLCEVSLSAFRGREVLYPIPEEFGTSTAGSLKDYYLDWSHLNLLSTVRGAEGIEPDPDLMLFPNVKIDSRAGGLPIALPLFNGAYGSTAVAKNFWDGLAIGAAISGVPIIIGENVCGMDSKAKFAKGKVISSPDMEHRVEAYRKLWDGKQGGIVVQTNVEDERMGVDVYALSKLEVDVIERKWGQGAKAIGGEVRPKSIEKAIMLKKRGYLVIPDPEDENVQRAFKSGVFRTFERHSRVGNPMPKDMIEGVEGLREQGAKRVFLKTGCYRPTDVAFTMKIASEGKIDAVTFDGASGGTGMSPYPMMNEMGTPTVYLEAQVLKCAELLSRKGRYVPDIIMAGGFINESQILKAIAMSNFGKGPWVKAITIGRSPITAVMKSSYFIELAKKERLPKAFAKSYGTSPEEFYINAPVLKARFGEKFKEIPWEAVGLYTYLHDRIGVGLQQLLAGTRKFKLDLINRNDLVALTEKASKVTGIPLVEDLEQDQLESILED